MAYLLKKTFLFFLLALTCINSVFASSISVYPMSSDLTIQDRYNNFQIQNTGGDTAYVQATIYHVENPGMPNQRFVPLVDNPYQVGLIVTPNKMVIPAGEMRVAQALYIGPPVSTDSVYEVKFSPVSGELVAVGSSKEISAGVELIIAYGTSVIIRPPLSALKPHVTAVRNGTTLHLSNTGNTTVTIGNCMQCQQKICKKIPELSLQLFPGNTSNFKLSQALPLQCQEEVLKNQFFSFNIA